ncbi:hypothetical protein [Streptomyces sp. 4N124]|uniref:hypothetical protein n=1 Tax=Streptomyces sp. 4N124 TaxID=3457420 RepID=UPI003FD58224
MEARVFVYRRATKALTATALTLAVGAGLGTGTSYAGGAHAVAVTKPEFQMPFKCDTHWRLDTYDSGHDPALDIVVKGNTGSSGKPVHPGFKGKVAQTFWDRGSRGATASPRRR